jgi:hypothetical protein
VKEENLHQILINHLPESTVSYGVQLWQQAPFHLRLTKARHTKVGDMRLRKGICCISLNRDLNPYLFLVTYVHEVAHWHVHLQHRKRTEPHGQVWQHKFAELLNPLLSPDHFPEPLLTLLIQHMGRPGASTFTDAELTKAFRQWDKIQNQLPLLEELKDGTIFSLRGKLFKKGRLLRKRFCCCELPSKRMYLVPADMPVSEIQSALF